ncbi:FAD-dependent oxidoreductase [Novosphingobium sp. MMS21-SN21R]|uniref:NAD(P)/FAD-dependent oxidoreductase n=1 Tax=Novosphingobium sp. MMS21-SN21R TaxID=2969298 RepID=UPI002884CB6B|nr:FAD-dependent oxidoreductase [Novosphingobium sp. MMS21-SN21R]MDT0507305.1 FAD-dependent oxidoreductase [Novosphingobium sp. MMS21-SN21R]
MHIAIVGAGMAGLSCADRLRREGHRVSLFDKGRGPGGRMSTRRMQTPLGELHFDHGAQYFTVRDPAFMAQVARWSASGVAAPWPAAGTGAWVGVPTMNAVVRDMAEQHDVSFGWHVRGLVRKDGSWHLTGDSAGGERLQSGPFDTVVVSLPPEQAAAIVALHDLSLASTALAARSQPCWTAMFAFDAALPTSRDTIRDAGLINWAARNSAKPGRGGPETWVVQANPQWSADHIEEPAEQVTAQLLLSLGKSLGVVMPQPVVQSAHRWRYAMSTGSNLGALWSAGSRIGVCGDWLLGPRVENAWLSGRTLASLILATVEQRAA